MSNSLNLTAPQWVYPEDFWDASVTVGAVIVPKSGLYVTDQTTLDNLVGFSESPAGVPLTFSATNPAPGPTYTDPSDTHITDLLNNTNTQFRQALDTAIAAQAAPKRPDRAPHVDAPLLQTTPIVVTTGLTVAMSGYDPATGTYYGTSTANGHYQTSPDAVTWTDKTYSPSTYTPGGSVSYFDETYMYAVAATTGRSWRAPKGVFNAWTEITPSDIGPLTQARPGSLLPLGNGVLLFGNYTSGDGDGSHIWRSTDSGATWTHVLDNPSGKHVHAIRKSPNTGYVWATLGDAGFQGVGLWRSTDSGATWTYMASNMYGIDMVFYPAVGGRPSLVIMEGDGLNRPLLMGYWEDAAVGDKVFPLTWFTGAPGDPATTRGTTRGIAKTPNGDVIYFTTTEAGTVGSKAGIYIVEGPDFTNVKLLKDTTGAEPAAYQETIIAGSTVFNYLWSFPLPAFATY